MKLVSLKINASSCADGIGSPKFKIENHITQFTGENGSGKTPVTQSIIYCLGYPVRFRQDIISRCRSVTLEVNISGVTYFIERFYKNNPAELYIKIFDKSGVNIVEEFHNEEDYSLFIFEVFGLNSVELITTDGKPSKLYISSVYPLIYLSQDSGYRQIYSPSSKFIKDQFSEVVRFLFGLNPKNYYLDLKEKINLKSKRSALDEQISSSKSVLKRIVDDIDEGSEAVFREELVQLNSNLNELKNSHGSLSASVRELNVVRDRYISSKRDLERDIFDANIQLENFEKIKNEINMEADALLLNAKAERLLNSFVSTCDDPKCTMFRGAKEAYGKHLLYLKDQLKDIDFNLDRIKSLKNKKCIELDLISKNIQELEGSYIGDLSSSDLNLLVKAVNEITRRSVYLEEKISAINNSKNLTLKIVRLEKEREAITNLIHDQEDKGVRGDKKIKSIRERIQSLTVNWLNVLETENISRSVIVDYDFGFSFGGEKIDAFTGSTKARVILASHAAIFEAYLETVKAPVIPWFVMDTPNQNELDLSDLTKFMAHLKILCNEYNIQIIFASKDFKLNVQEHDVIHVPSFDGKKHKMYLGAV